MCGDCCSAHQALDAALPRLARRLPGGADELLRMEPSLVLLQAYRLWTDTTALPAAASPAPTPESSSAGPAGREGPGLTHSLAGRLPGLVGGK